MQQLFHKRFNGFVWSQFTDQLWQTHDDALNAIFQNRCVYAFPGRNIHYHIHQLLFNFQLFRTITMSDSLHLQMGEVFQFLCNWKLYGQCLGQLPACNYVHCMHLSAAASLWYIALNYVAFLMWGGGMWGKSKKADRTFLASDRLRFFCFWTVALCLYVWLLLT